MLRTPGTRRLRSAISVVMIAVLAAGSGCRKKAVDPFPASGAVAGWEKTSETRVFAAKDLWQYIDGDAEQYLQAGVVSTSTSDYKYRDRLEAVVDVYTMGDPGGASKIFGGEHAGGGAKVQIGDAAVAHEQSVTFRKGPYLVRIVAYEATPGAQQALIVLAHGVEARL